MSELTLPSRLEDLPEGISRYVDCCKFSKFFTVFRFSFQVCETNALIDYTEGEILEMIESKKFLKMFTTYIY